MPEIDWHTDPEAAFGAARASGRPLLLYWGARWCPPCNRLRGAVFSRAGLLALAPHMVALHIDGDSPAAQRLAERFKVRSYPTLVVYRPDGAEITRLPCELDGERLVELLELALNARFTASESLSVALSRERALADDEWRILSSYSWDTDEHQLIKKLDFAAIVASMTRACTFPEAAVRLDWLALHAAAVSDESGLDQGAAIARLGATLSEPRAARRHFAIVTGYALELVRFLTAPGSDARAALAAVWSAALEGLENDATLDITDQLAALRTRVRIARLLAPLAGPGAPDPAQALGELVARRVAGALAALDGPDAAPAEASAADAACRAALRHALVNSGAGMLAEAGLPGEAEQLLGAELERSHAPFYFMHELAALAKKRGDPGQALRWYRQAWECAAGPATRLQWGATCLQASLAFAAHDTAAIERLAQQLLALLARMPDASCRRNRTQLQRIGAALASWNGSGPGADALRLAAGSMAI